MNTSTKVLVGAAMLAAIGSGITAAGILDAWLPGSRIGRDFATPAVVCND